MPSRLAFYLASVSLLLAGCVGPGGTTADRNPVTTGLRGLTRVCLEVSAYPRPDDYSGFSRTVVMRDPGAAEATRTWLAGKLPELRLDGGPDDVVLRVSDTYRMQYGILGDYGDIISPHVSMPPLVVGSCRVQVIRQVKADGLVLPLILYDQEFRGGREESLASFVAAWRLANNPPPPRPWIEPIGRSPSGLPMVVWNPRSDPRRAANADEGYVKAALTEAEEQAMLAKSSSGLVPWFVCFPSHLTPREGPKEVYVYFRPTEVRGRAVTGVFKRVYWYHPSVGGSDWVIGGDGAEGRAYMMVLPPGGSAEKLPVPEAPWLPVLETDYVRLEDLAALFDFVRTSPALPDVPGRRVDGRLPIIRVVGVPQPATPRPARAGDLFRVWLADGEVIELRKAGAAVTLVRSGYDVNMAPPQG
jgi:hypothetical protein